MVDSAIISTILGILGTLCAVFFGYTIYKRNLSIDSKQAGKETGVLFVEIGYIKSGIDDIKNKQEKQDERFLSLIERITITEASTKQAHKRIDRLDGQSRIGD